MESSINTPSVTMQFSEDEFLSLVTIINGMSMEMEDKSTRHLILKVYRTNELRKKKRFKSWSEYLVEEPCHRKR